jgi:hypothetical protein
MAEFTLGARASCSDGAMAMGGSLPGVGIGMGVGYGSPLVVEHAVPLGEIEVERHESVREGHLWGRRQLAIPISAVASVDAGIRLNITKEQVEDLPPLDHTG